MVTSRSEEPTVTIENNATPPPVDGVSSAEGGPIDDVNDVSERREVTFTLYPPKELAEFVSKDEEDFSADLVRKEEFASMLEAQIIRMRMVMGRHLRHRVAAKEEEAKQHAEAAERNAKEAEALREKLAKFGA